MDFIPGSLEDRDKFIEAADGHNVTAKKKVQAQIKVCNDNGKTDSLFHLIKHGI